MLPRPDYPANDSRGNARKGLFSSLLNRRFSFWGRWSRKALREASWRKRLWSGVVRDGRDLCAQRKTKAQGSQGRHLP